MKIALVHDDFCQRGGAERLFEEIAKIYPDATIYTSLVNWGKIPKSINKDRINTSFMQKIPFAANLYKLLLPLYPFAFESFDFSQFDLVISSTTRFAKSIITKPSAIHVSYINSVPRFLYNQNQADQYLSPLLRLILKPYFNWLKRWDKVASNRVDLYIANSKNVQKSVHNQYNRQSVMIHPFADTEFFSIGTKRQRDPSKELRASKEPKSDSYYIVVTRLVKWKKIDIAIQAACQLGVNLKIVGTGPDEQRLNQILNQVQNDKIGQNKIEFLGNVAKEELRALYQNATALIVTQEEDFGIAMVEAQSCGIPIIAYKAGGALEIVIDGKTGIFFKNQSPEAVKDAISMQSKLKWDISACRENALRFSKAVFVNSFKKSIDDYAAKTH